MANPNSRKAGAQSTRGNYISEWLGQRIYPTVRLSTTGFSKGNYDSCPFLTPVLSRTTPCVKNGNSLGVCTINTSSNGVRQDWLACPYRVIDSNLVSDACARIFSVKPPFRPTPASLLGDQKTKASLCSRIKKHGRGYVFFQDKLGGEISILGTPKSPELAFDVTIVEISWRADRFVIERYGILEVQTMDFHGSYRKAVSNLRDALRLHGKRFPKVLSENLEWAAEGIEGPNIANVFKRTFYQIMLKFELGGRGAAAGTVLAIPKAVWDSWQPFLGNPITEKLADGTYTFSGSSESQKDAGKSNPNAFICVFDLDADKVIPISPIVIEQFIRVTPERLLHQAFSVVPENMLAAQRNEDSILATIKARLATWWPELELAS